MNKENYQQLILEPIDNNRQINLCGPMDDNLKTIERRLGVEISYRGNHFKILGKQANCQAVSKLLKNLYLETTPVKGKTKNISEEIVHLAILETSILEQAPSKVDYDDSKIITVKTKRSPSTKTAPKINCRPIVVFKCFYLLKPLIIVQVNI